MLEGNDISNSVTADGGVIEHLVISWEELLAATATNPDLIDPAATQLKRHCLEELIANFPNLRYNAGDRSNIC